MTEQERLDPVAELDALIERASGGTGKVTERLPPGDEDQAAGWVRSLLTEGGKQGLEAAIDRIGQLPWGPGVKGIVAAWPDLKLTTRRALLKALSGDTADLRFRLSLCRGLHAVDSQTATKLVVAACKQLGRKPEPGPRGVFAGVMVGRGRPWILGLALSELKPADRNAVVHAVLACAFPGGFPPQTHLSLLKWLHTAGALQNLDADLLEPVLETVRRWSHKAQVQARSELGENLPETLAAALSTKTSGTSGTVDAATRAEPAHPGKPAEAEAPAAEAGDPGGPAGAAPGSRSPEPRREAAPRRGGGGAHERPDRSDPASTLRRVADQVQALQRELERTRAQLAQREDRVRRERPDRGSEGAEEVEALRRRNVQLEETVAELRARLEDLAGHHEDVAASLQMVGSGEPGAEAADQLRALIGLKLARQYAEFSALKGEPDDVVLREHYRDMLAHIFEVLASQGVVFPEVREDEESDRAG